MIFTSLREFPGVAFRIGLDNIVEPSDSNLNNFISLGKDPSRQYLIEESSSSKGGKKNNGGGQHFREYPPVSFFRGRNSSPPFFPKAREKAFISPFHRRECRAAVRLALLLISAGFPCECSQHAFRRRGLHCPSKKNRSFLHPFIGSNPFHFRFWIPFVDSPPP